MDLASDPRHANPTRSLSGAQLTGDHKLARAIEHASKRGDIHVIRLLLDDGSRYHLRAVQNVSNIQNDATVKHNLTPTLCRLMRL